MRFFLIIILLFLAGCNHKIDYPTSLFGVKLLDKVTIKFDMENEEFLGSNLIFPNEYKKVLFSEDEIYFLTKGIDDDSASFYDTRLNRVTGELTRIVQPTKALLRKQLENTDGPTDGGFKQTEIYQCKVVDKLF